MLPGFRQGLARMHAARGWSLLVVCLRIALGFAFVPSGLKKLLMQRFSDAENAGPFHEFLHAFYETGFFYPFVGAVQLVAAVLLMTQRLAGLGALIAFPITTAILVFCWSTGVVPTAAVVTLMWLGTLGLLAWEVERLAPILSTTAPPRKGAGATVDLRLWGRCGLGIGVLYLAACAAYGGVYRPRKVELAEPAFYVFPALLLLPACTFWIERRRRGRAGDPGAHSS